MKLLTQRDMDCIIDNAFNTKRGPHMNAKVITRHPIRGEWRDGLYHAFAPTLGIRREHRRKDLAVRSVETAIMASLAERNLERGKR